MKINDIYNNLPKSINLQKFHPKIEIDVDPFWNGENTLDLVKKSDPTINSTGNRNFVLKTFKASNKLTIDSFSNTNFNDIHLEENKENSLIKKTYKNLKKLNVSSLKFPQKKLRYPLIFISIIFFVWFNKIIVEHYTNSGYQKLTTLSKNIQSLDHAKKTLISAKTDFNIARILFTPFSIIPNKKTNNAKLIIQGGQHISDLGTTLIHFSKETQDFIEKKGITNIMYSQLLQNNKLFFQETEKRINTIYNIYEAVDINKNNSDLFLKLENFKSKLKQGQYYIHNFNNSFDDILEIFGHSERKKYLIAFQNNDEIRPMGGFMGSLGIVELFRGQVKEFRKNDIYFYEFKIKKEHFQKERAPEGINQLTPFLGLRDSNYFIKYSDSSDKIKYFMKKAGYQIDGIIYINQNSIRNILNTLGGFNSETLNHFVNKDNFSKIMSLLVESKVSKQGSMGTPKQVLFDFIKEFQKVLTNNNYTHIISNLSQDIRNREIILHSFNSSHNDILKVFGFYNEPQYEESLDFSYPVFTSISGNKSDRYIQTSFHKKVTNGKDCSFNTELTLNIEHSFGIQEQKEMEIIAKKYNINLEKDNLLSIQGNALNKQYIRVIIPKNAQVTPQTGLYIEEKQRGKNVAFYIQTSPGTKQQHKLKYSIPNKECKLYNYKHYKQAGLNEYNFSIDTFGDTKEFFNVKKDLFIN